MNDLDNTPLTHAELNTFRMMCMRLGTYERSILERVMDRAMAAARNESDSVAQADYQLLRRVISGR